MLDQSCFCPGLGHYMKTGVPIWAAILWLASAPVWAILWGLQGPGPPGPIPFVICHWTLWKSSLGGLPVALGWQGQPAQPQSFGDFHGMGTQGGQTDRYPGGPHMKFSVGCHQYYCYRQLGTWHWFHEQMDPYTVSFDTGIGVHAYCAEWGWLPSLWCEWASDIIEAEFPHLHGVTLREECLTSFFTPVSFEFVQGSCSDPDMTAPKLACLHVMVAFCELLHGHQAYGPIYDFGSNHDWDHLRVGHGWYDQ